MALPPTPRSTRPSLGQILNRLGSQVSRWVADCPQLQIWRHCDRGQTPYLQAYDPKSGQSFSATSEAEMRFWIEQRAQDLSNEGFR